VCAYVAERSSFHVLFDIDFRIFVMSHLDQSRRSRFSEMMSMAVSFPREGTLHSTGHNVIIRAVRGGRGRSDTLFSRTSSFYEMRMTDTRCYQSAYSPAALPVSRGRKKHRQKHASRPPSRWVVGPASVRIRGKCIHVRRSECSERITSYTGFPENKASARPRSLASSTFRFTIQLKRTAAEILAGNFHERISRREAFN